MTFNDDEIEAERRKATSRKANVDYDQRQAERDILFAALRDSQRSSRRVWWHAA
jgi:hypothetical protein